MTYFRHVISKALPYTACSLAIDENRLAFRVLDLAEKFPISENLNEISSDSLLTTENLGSSYRKAEYDSVVKLEEQNYVIVYEQIVDKTSAEYKKMWVPGAHFCIWFDGQKIHCDLKGSLTYFDLRNTAEYLRNKGGAWVFDFWVRNPDDPVTKCARSIVTTENMLVITNVDDLGEKWDAEAVMTGTTSKWLNLGYSLTPSSETVAPDGWVEFELNILDGKTHELADDVTWDGFIAEAVDGYIPHRRISVVNGIGRFRAQALGLLDGESMRVKVNHRFFSSRVESIIQVANNV